MNDAPATGSRPPSKTIPGPSDLRHYAAYRLVAWQPKGVLDDQLLDQLAEWISTIEKVARPFNRFIDLSRLSCISVRSRHVFEFARRRAEEFKGAAPVRTALFSDDWIGFGIAHLYEALMDGTLIHARAFRERTGAAMWLDVPAVVLNLDDHPAPP